MGAMRAVCKLVLASILAVSLAGCLPVTSQTPVGTTAGLGTDRSLIGVWRGKMLDNKNASYITFLAGKNDAKITAVAVTPTAGDESGGYGGFEISTSVLAGNHYMNVKEIHEGKISEDAQQNAEKSFPVLYRFHGKNRLSLLLLNEERTAAAIRAGKIKGTVEEGTYGDVILTADAAELDAFFKSHEAAELFDVLAELTRVE